MLVALLSQQRVHFHDQSAGAMTEHDLSDAVGRKVERSMNLGVCVIALDGQDGLDKSPFSFVRPLATLTEVELVIGDSRDRPGGRPVMTVRHRIKEAECWSRPRQDSRFRSRNR